MVVWSSGEGCGTGSGLGPDVAGRNSVLFAVAVVMAADGSNSSHLSRQSGVQRVQTLGAVEGAIVGAAADDSGALASGATR